MLGMQRDNFTTSATAGNRRTSAELSDDGFRACNSAAHRGGLLSGLVCRLDMPAFEFHIHDRILPQKINDHAQLANKNTFKQPLTHLRQLCAQALTAGSPGN